MKHRPGYWKKRAARLKKRIDKLDDEKDQEIADLYEQRRLMHLELNIWYSVLSLARDPKISEEVLGEKVRNIGLYRP